ncbi:glutamate--tRNA ligase [Candidatus Nomurabacteria bacterium]|nr:glutamate--tRNA ligase [Candidatus Nomurabacteria bacterium]
MEMENTGKVVTRFAPSPTGHMHAGSYRTAFFAYLFAKRHDGKFILRIEDTDKERSKEEYTQEIFNVFEKIGISYDEKYIQSENLERHKEVLQKLISEDKAYISREEAKDGSGIIKDIIRFRNPGKSVTFDDLIRGPITTDTTDLGDFVLAKNIDEPLFHLAVVVDDHDEGVNHVIRAEEHIANTPRQILIHEALGFDIPKYAHLPLVLAPDKTKMSKRKGAIPVVDYLDMGYLPEALLNAICLCGWNPGTEQEIFSREELEKVFDLDKVQKAGAVFGQDKLDWFNREYIKKLSQKEFWDIAHHGLYGSIVNDTEEDREILKKLEPLIRERMTKFSDMQNFFGKADGSTVGEFDYFFVKPKIDLSMLIWKGLKIENPSDSDGWIKKTKEYLKEIHSRLEKLENWDYESIKASIWDYAEQEGRGAVLWPMRVALSGREKSPDPFEISSILGKEETLKRLK